MKKNIGKVRESMLSFFQLLGKKAAEMPRTAVVQWLLFILLVFLTTALVSYRGAKIPTYMKAGQIAPYDIKADRDYEIVDEEATAKFRTEALQHVKDTYTFDPYIGAGIAERIGAALDEMRRLLKTYVAQSSDARVRNLLFDDLNEAQQKELKDTWVSVTGYPMPDKEWKYLVDSNFSEKLQSKTEDAIVAIMSHPVVDNKELLLEKGESGIAVRILPPAGDTNNAGEEDWNAAKIEGTLTVDDMKREALKGKYIPDNFNIDDIGDRIAMGIAVSLVQPNMLFDAQETEQRRQATFKDVKSVVINVQAGESIVRGGARYEPWHIKVIEGIRKEKSARSLPLEMVGSFLLIFTIYMVVYLFGRRYVKKFAPTQIDMIFMGSLMLVMLLMLRSSMFIVSAVYGTVITEIPRTALTYAIPLAAGAMLVRFIINSETAALFAVVLAAFSGIVMQGNAYFPVFTLMSSFVAAVAISHSDKRSSIFQAGIISGLINAVIVLSIHLINAASVVEPLNLNSILWYELSAFMNGIGAAIFVMVMAPVAESIFGYTTDIKLLELANLNHPLLRELIIRAPGTYHHSHLVGILAETAAEAIGVNPLLARVGAYYHDIGKIKKPQYFSENMPEGVSVHDNLSPHMSALIVGSHVKDGLELARMYKLPPVITAMIPEHHGTKMIGFFYQKAKESTDPDLQKIEQKDFMYQGPRPRGREAGILMLADGVEAAVRSLKEKTPTKIQQVVETIVDKSFTDGQLNECDLTLKDLNGIARAFTRILSSIYHQRVEYPKEALEREGDERSVFDELGGGGENKGGSLPQKQKNKS